MHIPYHALSFNDLNIIYYIIIRVAWTRLAWMTRFRINSWRIPKVYFYLQIQLQYVVAQEHVSPFAMINNNVMGLNFLQLFSLGIQSQER